METGEGADQVGVRRWAHQCCRIRAVASLPASGTSATPRASCEMGQRQERDLRYREKCRRRKGRDDTGLICGVWSIWRTRLEWEADAARQGIEGIHRRTSSGGSSRSKEGRLRADWCDGENEDGGGGMDIDGWDSSPRF